MKASSRLALIALLLAALGCKLVQGAAPRPTNPPVQGQAGLSTSTVPLSPVSSVEPSVVPVNQTPAFAPTLALSVTPEITLSPTPPGGLIPGTLPQLPTINPAFTPDPDLITSHLQIFNELWNTIYDNYLYGDFNGLDMQALKERYIVRIQAGLSDQDFYLALHSFVGSLGDQHSTFFDPEQAARSDAEYEGQFNYAGIGVLTSLLQEKKRLAAIVVFPGSPAERAGIQMHDSLISVDGQPLVDDQGSRINLLRGDPGTTIQVEVQTPGQPSRLLTITRQQVEGRMPVPYALHTSPGGKRIGYIMLPTFNAQTIAPDVGLALEALTKDGPLDGLVLDNRENGGGANTVMIDTAGYFTGETLGYMVRQKDEIPFKPEDPQDINGSQQVPLVVLVGKGTASFGEVFAGAFKDLGRAYLIGETTDGNVEILSIFNFSDGSRAWIAASTFRPVNDMDVNWEETGIVPDLTVPTLWDEITPTNDPALLAALNYFDLLNP